MTLPAIPATIAQADWYQWDILVRAEDLAFRQAATAAAQAADTQRITAMNRQAAAMEANAAAITKAYSPGGVIDNFTDSELINRWVTAMQADWNIVLYGGASIMTKAQALLVEYRKKYPYVPPAP